MVTNYAASFSEVISEINKLAMFVKDMSDKIDSYYDDGEDEELVEDELVVMSDVWDDEELEQQCSDFHPIMPGDRDSDSED
jgi:hypothetical protein